MDIILGFLKVTVPLRAAKSAIQTPERWRDPSFPGAFRASLASERRAIVNLGQITDRDIRSSLAWQIIYLSRCYDYNSYQAELISEKRTHFYIEGAVQVRERR